LVAPDIEAWFQQDKFQGNSHIVAQWADLHDAVAQALSFIHILKNILWNLKISLATKN
jgi:hypothetical protein